MAQDEPHWWQQNRRRLITLGVIALCLLAIILIVTVSIVYGTGLGEGVVTSVAKTTRGTEPTTITITQQHQPGKTLWDWMQLLIIPVVLAVAAFLFNLATTRTEQKIADKRYKSDQEIADKRYKNDQEIAADKQKEDLLQSYLDRLSELLLNNKLRASADSKDEVRYIARARTLTVLSRLDGSRKRSVLQFLHESDLISSHSETIVQLEGADLSGANLHGALLNGANLNGADLSHARLRFAHLNSAHLNSVYLNSAYLNFADLSDAHLNGADLSDAHLNGAFLSGTNLSGALITQEQIDSALDKPTGPL